MDGRKSRHEDVARGATILLVALIVSLLIIGGRLGSQRFMTVPPTSTPVPTATPLPTPLPTVTPPPAQPPTPTPLPAAPTPTPLPVPVPEVDEAYERDGRNIVCIDPGHGGIDLGNVRIVDSEIVLQEKDLTLAHSLALAERLRADGFEVVMTRDSDTEVNPSNEDVNGDGITADPDGPAKSDQLDDLQARVNICNLANADLLVDVHYNGAENTALQGYEVWYNDQRPFSGRSKAFAELMHTSLAEAYAAAGYAANDRGIGIEDHAVTGPARPGKLVPSNMPGAVIEGIFLSNDDDAEFITSGKGEDTLVGAYEKAVKEYFDAYPG